MRPKELEHPPGVSVHRRFRRGPGTLTEVVGSQSLGVLACVDTHPVTAGACLPEGGSGFVVTKTEGNRIKPRIQANVQAGEEGALDLAVDRWWCGVGRSAGAFKDKRPDTEEKESPKWGHALWTRDRKACHFNNFHL